MFECVSECLGEKSSITDLLVWWRARCCVWWQCLLIVGFNCVRCGKKVIEVPEGPIPHWISSIAFYWRNFRKWSNLSIIPFATFSILFPNTVHKVSESTPIGETLTKFSWASDTQHNSSIDVCFVFKPKTVEKIEKKPQTVQSTEWYRA